MLSSFGDVFGSKIKHAVRRFKDEKFEAFKETITVDK